MDRIIYSTEFYCKLCEKPAKIDLHSTDSSFTVTDKIKADVLEWGQHYHWVDNHQICAICGKFVDTDKKELDLIQVEVMQGDVHPLYTKWDTYPERGLLTVHKECSKKMFAKATG
jgi:hypothetical protein